jgi:tetratricopeptide (TPR) repeat protein
MRIERYRYGTRSRRRRRSGCLSQLVLLSIFTGILTLAWNWAAQWLNAPLSSNSADLNDAQAAFNRGDLDTAIELARQVLDVHPNDVRAIILLARALIYRSYSDYNHALDRASALEVATQALERLPADFDLLAIHAFVLQANGQPLEAAEMAERVLDVEPNHALARLALGLSYGAVGGFDLALSETQRAAQLPQYPLDALRALAIAYSDLGRYSEAIATIERAIELNDHLVVLYFERALYALQIGDADGATEAYFRILAYDPENVKARLRLCELSSMMRERETALSYCQEVTERAPQWADGWYQLGREYFLQGNYAAAQEHLHRCTTLQVAQNVPISERRFECWYLQGQAAEILGDCEALIAIYNEYRAMAADGGFQQTWSYPPEGPPMCT